MEKNGVMEKRRYGDWIKAEFGTYGTTLRFGEGHGETVRFYGLGFYGIMPADTWKRLTQLVERKAEIRAVRVEDGFDLWAVTLREASTRDAAFAEFMCHYYGEDDLEWRRL